MTLRIRTLLLAVVALGVGLGVSETLTHATDDVRPWLTVGAAGSNVQCSAPDACSVFGEDVFQITINSVKVPDPGFDAVDARVDLIHSCPEGGPSPCVRELHHMATDNCIEQVPWPAASFCQDRTNNHRVPHFYASTGVTYPKPQSHFAGTLIGFQVQCQEHGLHKVTFEANYWSDFLLQSGIRAEITKGPGPFEGEMVIDCQPAGATATPRPPATATPRPGDGTGDADCSGGTDARDALAVLQVAADLIGSVGCPASSDVDLDGDSDAIDAALILQFVARLLLSLPV